MASKITLTPEDITKLVNILKDAYEPIVKAEVENAVREIPFRVREHLEYTLATEIRNAIRAVVEKQIHITVGVKDAL